MGTNTLTDFSTSELKILPNPVNSDEFVLVSSLPQTKFIIFDVTGNIIIDEIFKGKEKRFSISSPPGVYYLRYKTSNNNYKIIKVIKL